MSEDGNHMECGDLSPLSPPGDLSPDAAPKVASESADLSAHSKDWPHAPVHRLGEHDVYMVTAGTLGKKHLFHNSERLDLLEQRLLALAQKYHWQLEAWAVFSNHYHFICRGTSDSADLRRFITHLHADSARELNRIDQTPGRKVWHNFWDLKLTFERSYLTRLHYVHENAVKHALVPVANQYRWCSAAWFERTATAAQVQTIYGFKTDKVEVPDDF